MSVVSMHVSQCRTHTRLLVFAERMSGLRGRTLPSFSETRGAGVEELARPCLCREDSPALPLGIVPQSPCPKCCPVVQRDQPEGWSSGKGTPGEGCLGQSWAGWSLCEGVRVQSRPCHCSEQTRLLVTVADSCTGVFGRTAADSQVGALVGRRPAGS